MGKSILSPSEEFRADCPCRKTKCPRHKHCAECKAYHAAKGRLPYCLRKKKI